MMNVTLRNIVDGDLNFICNNWLDDERMQIFPKDIEELKLMINSLQTKKYNGKYFEMFLIIDKFPVGVISLYHQTDDEASVGIYIDSMKTGKGYGTAGYSEIIKIAKQKGYKFLSAGVLADNFASIQLHEKFGFKKISESLNKHNRKQVKYILKLADN